MVDLKLKIDRYQNLLFQLVEGLAQERNTAPGANLEYQGIADKEQNHFLLVRVGWHERKFHYLVLLHLDLKPDGTIWIQQNNTEIRLDEVLAEKGVDTADLVLGFRPDWMRKLAEVETVG